MVASRSLTLDDRLVLLPWLDLTEHTHDAPTLALSADKKGVVLPGVTVEEGDSVSMSYNKVPNSDFLSTYGFHDANRRNPNEEITIYAYSAMKATSQTHPCAQLAKVPSKGKIPKHLRQLPFVLTSKEAESGNLSEELLLCAAAATMPATSTIESWGSLGEVAKSKAKEALSGALMSTARKGGSVKDDAMLLEDATRRLKIAISYRMERKALMEKAAGQLGEGKVAPRLHLTLRQDLDKVGSEAKATTARWHEDLGDAMAAEQAWREALELDPTRVDVQTALGLVYMKTGRPVPAHDYFKTALDAMDYDSNPGGWARAACNLGDSKFGQGDLPGAMSVYESALKADGSLSNCKDNLVLARQAKAKADAKKNAKKEL